MQTRRKIGVSRSSIRTFPPLLEVEYDQGQIHLEHPRFGGFLRELERIDHDRITKRLQGVNQAERGRQRTSAIELQGRNLAASGAPLCFADRPELETALAGGILD